MQTNIRQFLKFLIIAAVILPVLLCSGCNTQKDKSSGHFISGGRNSYTELLLESLPDFYLKENGKMSFSLGKEGNAAVCLGVQTPENKAVFEDSVFYPHGLLTVVFAADRSRTDFCPSGWKELADSGLKVYFPSSDSVARRAAFAAAAYGAEGKNYTEKAAADYLSGINKKGNLVSRIEEAQILICFDAEAADMIKKGKDLSVTVPRDGTLSYTFGVFGKIGNTEGFEEKMLKAGFRLTDGRCENRYYPEAGSYLPAVCESDREHFNSVTKNTISTLRRKVFHVRHFNSADGRENIILMNTVIFLILIWTAFALHRSIRKDMQHWVLTVSFLTVGWILLCMFKYMLYDVSFLSRMCWYLYYVFTMGLPFTSLYISVVVDQPVHKRYYPVWFKIFSLLYPLLLLTVVTNDFHQLVFRFDFNGNWSDEYTYGAGFYAVFAFALISFVLSFIILTVKSRKSPKRNNWIWPAAVGILLIIFNLGYALNIPIFRESNMTLVFCLFSVLFVEALLNAGLIPTNIGYSKIFSSSPLGMLLLDKSGKTVIASEDAAELTEMQRFKFINTEGISVNYGDDALLHSCPIHGGTAVWKEDISSINELHRNLKLSIENNRKANMLLRNENQIMHKKLSYEVKEELFSELEKNVQDKTSELSVMIQNLPEAEDRKKQTAYITLLLCHIKRRCNLFFLSQEGENMSSSELAMYIDELSEFASYSDIHTVVRCGITGSVAVENVIICYDFYFSLLSWAVKKSNATLIGQIEEQNGKMIFSILSSQNTDSFDFPETLRKEIEKSGATVLRRTVDESEGIYLVFTDKGGPDK